MTPAACGDLRARVHLNSSPHPPIFPRRTAATAAETATIRPVHFPKHTRRHNANRQYESARRGGE